MGSGLCHLGTSRGVNCMREESLQPSSSHGCRGPANVQSPPFEADQERDSVSLSRWSSAQPNEANQMKLPKPPNERFSAGAKP